MKQISIATTGLRIANCYERASGPAEGAPAVYDVFMAPTCDRIYFSALQSMFYAQQQ